MVPRFATLGRIPKGVWVLGGVSLLMDVSSEMIHSLLPLFMATTLGASVIIIGLIEGLAEATALILKVFSAQSATMSASVKDWRCWATAWARSVSRCLPSPLPPGWCLAPA
ncbi:major facilitator superfamily permease [Klebsiella pneumoniae subsp. rhinoscleromatis]|nr:major facilitator superfamily permease [Klebsiella pneumoniae subsp. rhinoscleromatis]